MSDTSKYTVTEHAIYSRAAGREGYTIVYSVRLPDVQQVPGAATRYLETAAGRRRAWRAKTAALRVAEEMNVVLDKAMTKMAADAQKFGRSSGYDHANWINAYGGALRTEEEIEVPEAYRAVATYYTAAYLDGQQAYEDEQIADEEPEPETPVALTMQELWDMEIGSIIKDRDGDHMLKVNANAWAFCTEDGGDRSYAIRLSREITQFGPHTIVKRGTVQA